METKTCSSCGAEIFWARTVSGGTMPIDAEPVEGGNIKLYTPKGEGDPAPLAVVSRKGDENQLSLAYTADVSEKRYVTHFATCEYAAVHRRRPGSKEEATGE